LSGETNCTLHWIFSFLYLSYQSRTNAQRVRTHKETKVNECLFLCMCFLCLCLCMCLCVYFYVSICFVYVYVFVYVFVCVFLCVYLCICFVLVFVKLCILWMRAVFVFACVLVSEWEGVEMLVCFYRKIIWADET
jgi:hypothetical protein